MTDRPTDRPTNRRTDKAGCRVACTRLKIVNENGYFCCSWTLFQAWTNKTVCQKNFFYLFVPEWSKRHCSWTGVHSPFVNTPKFDDRLPDICLLKPLSLLTCSTAFLFATLTLLAHSIHGLTHSLYSIPRKLVEIHYHVFTLKMRLMGKNCDCCRDWKHSLS